MRRGCAAIFLAGLVLLGCAGGGSGGGPANATLFGRILWIESNAAPDPQASVSAGLGSTQSDIVDGSFTLEVSVNTDSVLVSYSSGGGEPPVVMEFTFPPARGTVDIGDLYIGPDLINVHGTVVDASDLSPLADATVKLGGRSAATEVNGEFTLIDVAYSFSSPAAFGDLIGEVTKQEFVTRLFGPPTTPISGVIEVGTIPLSPESSGDPPPLPFNISGTILPIADGVGATVEIKQGATTIRTTIADIPAQYRFWVPAGTYTIVATSGNKTGSAQVTLESPGDLKVVNVTIS